MAVAKQSEVRGLLVPLQGGRLVLPDSVILQVLTGGEIVAVENSPSWMLGIVTWQKRKIPVISFELASNQGFSNEEGARILVLKSVNNIEKMPFYAVVISGIPHPVRINAENISAVENRHSTSPMIQDDVLIEGEPVSIPNVEAVEEMLISQFGLFTPAA